MLEIHYLDTSLMSLSSGGVDKNVFVQQRIASRDSGIVLALPNVGDGTYDASKYSEK